MSNNEQIKMPPRMGRMGRGRNIEKPKDFKKAIKRLFSELKNFKILIFIALILASLGSILSNSIIFSRLIYYKCTFYFYTIYFNGRCC